MSGNIFQTHISQPQKKHKKSFEMYFARCLSLLLVRLKDIDWASWSYFISLVSLFRSGRISSVYIVGCLLVGNITLFQNLFILSDVVL